MYTSLRAKALLLCWLIALLLPSLPVAPLWASSPKASGWAHTAPPQPAASNRQDKPVNATAPLPPPYEYHSFSSGTVQLYPYVGTHVALLVPADYYDPVVLGKITQAVDLAYAYYKQATGRDPNPHATYQYQGRNTIAVVPDTCGGGCGNVGWSGIELPTNSFDVLFRGVADRNQYDQVVFYELGRNFWFYEEKIAYPAQDAAATGFAIFMRFMSMEAAGVAGAPFGDKDFTTFKAEVKGLFPLYLANPAFNWSNTLAVGKAPMAGYDAKDLFASFLFALRERFGDAFLMHIWQTVGQMPTRTTAQDAVNNFVTAASRTAGQDLSSLFAYNWRWPVSSQRPFTIPALRQWTPATGVYNFTNATRIIIDSPTLNSTAAVFANDLRDLMNLTIPVVQGGTPATGDIVLALGSNDTAIGNEGYLMTVGGTIVIRARTAAGVFYGTRTMLQLLKQGTTIVAGSARDWPSFPERSMMVDNGRKYFSPDWLKNHIRELAYLKYNYFHLHLSDDQGFHLESNTVTPTAPVITKAQLAEIIALATQYHITIIPEIDMPGHMTAILPPHLRLPYDNGTIPNDGYLNIASDAGYTFAEQLLAEYLPLFPGPYWHIGGDEFHVEWNHLNHLRDYARTRFNNPNATAQDGFVYFANHLTQILKNQQKQARMWANPLPAADAVSFDPTIILELWDLRLLSPQQAIAAGHTVMNASFYPTYYVQGWEPSRPQYPAAALYDQWTPQKFFIEQMPPYAPAPPPDYTLPNPPTANLLGGKFHIWSDNPTAVTEKQVAADIYEKLRAMAQSNWGSPKVAPDYATFAPLLPPIGRAPGYLQPIDQPYDFSGEIVNPNDEIPDSHYGNLTGDGTFGWQTGACAIDVQTNGFVFTLNSGDGNPLNYSGLIDGSGSLALLAAPHYSSVRGEPIVLSGDRPNRYTGVTTMKKGVVKLAKTAGITAIPGDLVMENQGDNDELQWAADEQIADGAQLTIQSPGGKLNLNNFNETIRALTLVNGATIDTGTDGGGQLTVTHFWYNNVGIAAGTYTAATAPAYLKGNGRLVVLESAVTIPLIKIMPLGDSITYIDSSYRGLLYTQLRQAGYNVDFVGTQSDPAEGGADPDHEGHDGAVIGPGHPYEWDGEDSRGYSDRNNLYNLAPTFMAQNPDVILLLIGINDYANYRSATGRPISYNANMRSPAKLAALIDRLLSIKPDVKILVGSLLPVAPAWRRDVTPFNAAIARSIATRAAVGKSVYFVNLNTEAGIDPTDSNQLYDGLHPTLAGSQKMATVWFNHLVPILSRQPQLFVDGFETGNLNRWSAQLTDSGDLAVSASAALTGSYGMSTLLDDNVAIYVTDDRPTGETSYQAQFRFDPNTMRMANGNLYALFFGYTGASTQVLRLEVRFAAGQYQVRAALRDDGNLWINSAFFAITDAPHLLHLDWQAATAAGANNGSLAFRINGVLKATLTGVDNDTRRIDRVRLGAVLGIDTGTRGSAFFDAYEAYHPPVAAASAAQAPAEQPEEESAFLEEVTAEEVAAEAAEALSKQLFLPLVVR